MDLNINEIYHNYIVRVVIFSIFLYKNEIKSNLYNILVSNFIKKRIPWKINLKIDLGVKVSLEDEREIILNELLDNIESDYMSIVTASFDTPLKKTIIRINLKNEEIYNKFIYS